MGVDPQRYRQESVTLPHQDSVEVGDDGICDDALGDGLSPTGSSNLPSPTPRKSYADLKRELFMGGALHATQSTVVFNSSSSNGGNKIFTHLTPTAIDPIDIDADASCSEHCWHWVENSFEKLKCSGSFKRSTVYRDTITVFNTVDRWASRIFPLTFLTAMLIYYCSYMYVL